MKLYKSDNAYAWEDDIVFEDKLGEYILQDDVKDYYGQEDEIEFYYEVDAEAQEVYLDYCNEHNLVANQSHNLREYMEKARS